MDAIASIAEQQRLVRQAVLDRLTAYNRNPRIA